MIAVGRVVDDSIVVLENIYSHLQLGKEKRMAIPTAVREVARAVTASTLTTVAVFLPIAFAGGLIGELFSSFSVAVTVALVASLFVSLTIIPVRAYWFLKAPKSGKLQVHYQKDTALDRRIWEARLRSRQETLVPAMPVSRLMSRLLIIESCIRLRSRSRMRSPICLI